MKGKRKDRKRGTEEREKKGRGRDRRGGTEGRDRLSPFYECATDTVANMAPPISQPNAIIVL